MTLRTWRRIREVRRWEGWRGVLRQAAKKACRPVIDIRRWLFFEADLLVPLPATIPGPPLEVRFATPRDLEVFADALGVAGIDPVECRRRLARGDRAVVVLSGHQLTHVQWLSYASPVVIEEIGVTLHMSSFEAYNYNAVTLPEWRGRGIADLPVGLMTSYSLSRGVTRHIYYVRADNIQGLKTPIRLGRKHTKTVWAVRIVGMKRRRLFGVTRQGSPSLVRS